MEMNQEPHSSQLFLVRLWTDGADGVDGARSDGESGVHGKVQHVLTGKAASFDDWPALVDLLRGMMPPANRIGDSTPANRP